MTWTDPIVEEVRRVRHEYAARLHFDLDVIYQDLKSREAASGRTYVDLSSLPSQKAPADRADQQNPRS
jgi:hypothetical protein